MKDVEGEIPVPANLGDPAPEFFLSIWDDPHIIKIEFVGGKKGFYCFWCTTKYRTGSSYNATKALYHAATVKNKDIGICIGPIPLDFANCYQTMVCRKIEVKEKKDARLRRFQMEQEVHTQKVAEAIVLRKDNRKKAPPSHAQQRKKASPSSTSTPSSGTSIVLSSSQSTFGRDYPRGKTGGSFQSKLTLDVPNPAVEKRMTACITRFIHCLGFPFQTPEDHLFEDMIDAARHLPRTYKIPNRHQIGGQFLEANFQAMQHDTYSKLHQDIDIFKASLLGDGATVHKNALFNILARSAHCGPSTVEIVNCKEWLAEGRGKDA